MLKSALRQIISQRLESLFNLFYALLAYRKKYTSICDVFVKIMFIVERMSSFHQYFGIRPVLTTSRMNLADALGVRSFCGLLKLTENNPNLSLQFTKL